jgi:hypothetical protein
MQLLSLGREYALFVQFTMSQGMLLEHARHAVVGMARKKSLINFKKWVRERRLTPNEIPFLLEIKDAQLEPETYYGNAGDTERRVIQLLESFGPRPALTLSRLIQLAEVGEMQYLRDWIKRGLLGPFVMSDARASDESFHDDFRRKLTNVIRGGRQIEVRETDCLACVSYMHTKPSHGKESVDPTDKMSSDDAAKLKRLIADHLERHNGERIFVWVDQACKGSRLESQFDWLSEGLMPYAVLPVLKVSGRAGLSDVCGRLWLKVELILGMNGAGVSGFDQNNDISHVYNASEHMVNPDHAISAVCRSVLAGYTDNLETFWVEDFLRLQRWSVQILLQDRGPARRLEYERGAAIEVRPADHGWRHEQLLPQQVKKLVLEIATQPQYNPFGSEAYQRAPDTRQAAWTDQVPVVEVDEPTRTDRLFFCRTDEVNVVPQTHRYIDVEAIDAEEGGRYSVGIPLSETPTGEIIIKALRTDGSVNWTKKVNIPYLESMLSQIALRLEVARLRGRPDDELLQSCRLEVRALDAEVLSFLRREYAWFPAYRRVI